MQRQVLICCNATCHQQGSDAVLLAFQQATHSAAIVESSGCLGQCGIGPMVLVLPEEVWYSRVRPADVLPIVEEHLKRGKVVTRKLHPEFHPDRSIWVWAIALGICLVFAVPMIWFFSSQPY